MKHVHLILSEPDFPQRRKQMSEYTVKRKYNCSFFHLVNGLNGSTNIKVRTVHFALGLYCVRTDHKEDPEGVKMGAGICLFMYPRKQDLLHWVWDLTIVKDFSYDTCCLCPKTLLNLCHAFIHEALARMIGATPSHVLTLIN